MNALGFTYTLQGTMTYRVRRAGVDLGTVWRTRTAWGWKRMDGTQGSPAMVLSVTVPLSTFSPKPARL